MKTKGTMKISVALASAALMCLPLSPAYANGLFDQIKSFFVKDKADIAAPTNEGTAPFAPQSEASYSNPLNDIYTPHSDPNQFGIALDKAHRSAEDLSRWLSQIVAESLSVTPFDLQSGLQIQRTYFSGNGFGEYVEFLNTGFLDSIRSGAKNLHGFPEKSAILINEGAVDGAYQWLFQIPVMVTLVPVGLRSYERSEIPEGQKYLMTVQLGRVATGGGDHGVVVESWTAQAQ